MRLLCRCCGILAHPLVPFCPPSFYLVLRPHFIKSPLSPASWTSRSPFFLLRCASDPSCLVWFPPVAKDFSSGSLALCHYTAKSGAASFSPKQTHSTLSLNVSAQEVFFVFLLFSTGHLARSRDGMGLREEYAHTAEERQNERPPRMQTTHGEKRAVNEKGPFSLYIRK